MSDDVVVSAVDCVHTGREGRHSRALLLALVVTALFMVVEAIGGWLANSLALLADAGHMLADVGSLALAAIAARLAQRPATAAKTYGYLRLEIFAAVVNGAVLIGLALLILWEAYTRFSAPPDIEPRILLGVATAGLIANTVVLRVLHAGHEHNLNVRGAYLHVLGDLLGSIGAVGAGAIIWLTNWTSVDAVVSVVIAILIAVSAIRLLRDSVDILLEATPRHISLARVAEELESIEGVSDVHDLHVWTVTSGMVAMTGHAVVSDTSRSGDVLRTAAERLASLGVDHVTIQLEPERRCPEALTV